jgi:hypothetical protein
MLVTLSSFFFHRIRRKRERERRHAERNGSCSNALLKRSELEALRNVPQRATVQGPLEITHLHIIKLILRVDPHH